MIHKITAVLLSALLFFAAAPSALAEGNGELPSQQDCFLVYDAADLAAIADYPEGNFKLAADIDMSGAEWTPLAFFGTLDGDGHALLNLKVRSVGGPIATTIDGNWKEYDSCFAGLFGYMEGAEIRNLTILGADVTIGSDTSCFCGMLSGCMRDCVVTNCAFSGSVSLTQSAVMCGVGGISGYGCGDIIDCRVDAELILTDTNQEVDCEEFAGGVIGCGHPNITGCTVNTQIYASVHGYCHNGGLVGMHHVDIHENVYTSVIGNTVTGCIHFFEHVKSRRAYADPVIGEKMNPIMKVRDNEVDFNTEETKDYSLNLYPCTCGVPKSENAVGGTCTQFGYIEHVCPSCGYTHRDTYTFRVHEPGEWQVEKEATLTEEGLAARYCVLCGEWLENKVIAPHTPGEWTVIEDATYTESGTEARYCTDCGVLIDTRSLNPHVAGEWMVEKAPTYQDEGRQVRYCTDCGARLEEEPVPPLNYAESCELSAESVRLPYRSASWLNAQVLPASAADHRVTWSSADESIATVDENGLITAVGRGSTFITCTSCDGAASARCEVTVRYTWWQWIIVILCFGWIWY